MDLIDANFSKISRKSVLNFWIVIADLAQPFLMSFSYKMPCQRTIAEIGVDKTSNWNFPFFES